MREVFQIFYLHVTNPILVYKTRSIISAKVSIYKMVKEKFKNVQNSRVKEVGIKIKSKNC